MFPFIDGTVEGTDITSTDGNLNSNHTFLGNGCPNLWDATKPDNGGLGKACETRIVKTADNENQKNGTYYTYNALTSGSGPVNPTSSNQNSPDTFCPLGWQLPYSGTGGDYYNKSRSWYFLFTSYGIAFNIGTAADATKIKSYPFSYNPSGRYNWWVGKLFNQGNSGFFWSIAANNTDDAYRLHIDSEHIYDKEVGGKINGTALRCVSELAS